MALTPNRSSSRGIYDCLSVSDTITAQEFQSFEPLFSKNISVTFFSNQTFGVHAIASEKDTNVIT
jgi:hypothetical protein